MPKGTVKHVTFATLDARSSVVLVFPAEKWQTAREWSQNISGAATARGARPGDLVEPIDHPSPLPYSPYTHPPKTYCSPTQGWFTGLAIAPHAGPPPGSADYSLMYLLPCLLTYLLTYLRTYPFITRALTCLLT